MMRDQIDFLATAILEAYDGSAAEIALHLDKKISEAGFVIVPKEPTDAMVQAAHIGYRESTWALGHNLPDIYRAMIEASQENQND